MQTEETIEVCNDQIAQREDECCDGLYDKLMHSLHAVAVIEDANQIYHQSTYRHCYR